VLPQPEELEPQEHLRHVAVGHRAQPVYLCLGFLLLSAPHRRPLVALLRLERWRVHACIDGEGRLRVQLQLQLHVAWHPRGLA